MTEVLELLDGVPGGVLWALFFILVFGPPAIFSKTAAEKFGSFGTLARWWRNRAVTKIEQESKKESATITVLEGRIKVLEDHISAIQKSQQEERRAHREAAAEDRRAWRDALDAAEEEIDEVRRWLRIRDKSVFELYDWSVRARVSALEGGVNLPPAPEISFLAAFENNELESTIKKLEGESQEREDS